MGSMVDLANKLGIKPGMMVCLLDAPEETAVALRAAAPDGVTFLTALPPQKVPLVLFWPSSRAGLVAQFALLQQAIEPDGAVWAVIPKKADARRRSLDFGWDEVQQAGLETDLVDNKIVSITAVEYGTRFVIRKDRRDRYR